MFRSLLLVAACVALPSALTAQGTPRPQAPDVPRHMQPPPGKCRIWMEGVPAAQQPAPTDCRTALRQKPANGTVIFGPAERELEASGFQSNPGRARPRPTAERAREARRPADSTARGVRQKADSSARADRQRSDSTPSRRPETTS